MLNTKPSSPCCLTQLPSLRPSRQRKGRATDAADGFNHTVGPLHRQLAVGRGTVSMSLKVKLVGLFTKVALFALRPRHTALGAEEIR
jgi:hypothetical protein